MSWLIVSKDLPASVIPGVLFTLSAWRASSLGFGRFPVVLIESFGYFWLYIYSFCLANQLMGAIEDETNKPHRPLCSGLVSRYWMRRRLAATLVGFALVGVILGVGAWMLAWLGLVVAYNYLGWHRHWVTRNLFIALGAAAQLGAAWALVAPIGPVGWRWIAFLPAQAGVVITLQDLRDVRGDRRVGRSTAPLRFGERGTRLFLAGCFLLLPVAGHWELQALPHSPRLQLVDTVQWAMCLVVFFRLLREPDPARDHITYQTYCYWYCVMCASILLAF